MFASEHNNRFQWGMLTEAAFIAQLFNEQWNTLLAARSL